MIVVTVSVGGEMVSMPFQKYLDDVVSRASNRVVTPAPATMQDRNYWDGWKDAVALMGVVLKTATVRAVEHDPDCALEMDAGEPGSRGLGCSCRLSRGGA